MHGFPIVCLLMAITLISACSQQARLPTSQQPPAAAVTQALPAEQMAPNANHNNEGALALPAACLVSETELASDTAPLTNDIWSRIRQGYQLPDLSHRRIDSERRWYARHPQYMQRVSERARRYMFHIVEVLEAREMPLELALLPIVESAFDAFAYSHGRASGMWQIVPGTGRMLGLKQNWWYDGRRDVTASTRAALDYLQKHHQRFDGDWLLALAAYNSGAGTVAKAIRKNRARQRPTDFWQLDLPKETRAYVPRLLALAQIIAQPSAYNLDLTPVPNQPYFTAVDIGSQIDLAQAAAFAAIDIKELYQLNPAFNRWATDPDGPHRLLVPVDKAAQLRQQLATLPADQRVQWQRYTIAPGDSLSTIAQQHGLTVDALRRTNRLSSHHIRAGHTLMIPTASKDHAHYRFSHDARVAQRHQAVDRTAAGQMIDYLVKPGDSLWSISRRHQVPMRKLAYWNSMAPTDPIKPGQRLKLWTAKPSVSPPRQTHEVMRKVSYKVRRGDSLARIAEKFRLNIQDILHWNSVPQPNYLRPGQSLTLFVDVTASGG